MTFSEWYKELSNTALGGMLKEGSLENFMCLAWQEGYEQGMREEEDRHIGKDL